MTRTPKMALSFLKAKNKQKGFTLMELLVVIAIIGLISTIVLVAVSGTTERARIARGLQFSHSLQNILGSYAVGIWNFDEGTGTTANDTSGWGNTGTLVAGPAWRCTSSDPGYTPSGQGCSLSFDGVDDCVNIPDVPLFRFTTDFSVEAWFNRAGNTSALQHVVAKQNDWHIRMNSNGTSLNFSIRKADNSNNIQAVWSGTVAIGQRYHAVGVWKSATNEVLLYVNGNLVATNTSVGIYTGAQPVRMGCATWGVAELFNGLIDEVRIYNQALTSAQIESQYYAGLQRLLSQEKINEEAYQ